MRILRFISAIILSGGVLAPTGGMALDLGDRAPPLVVKKWIQGGPIDLKSGRGKNVYVIEFWATWCAPCLTSIPHLSQLQRMFQDQNVVVIGISDEAATKVETFVRRMGEKMIYPVALDKERGTYKAYMEALGIRRIPYAFVIDQQGRLVWHGPPLRNLDTVLRKVLDGTLDLQAVNRQLQVEKLMPEYFNLVSTGERNPAADKMGRQIVDHLGDNAALLNQFAWHILTHRQVRYRDLELALLAGEKAYELTQGKDAAILDTYARALFDIGQVQKAIEMQKHAVNICTETALRQGLQNTLERYQKAVRP